MRSFILLAAVFTTLISSVDAGNEIKPPNLAENNPKNRAGSIELKGHTGSISCLAISPDGRWLVTGGQKEYVTGGDDRTARLWDLKSKNPATGSRVLKGHTDSISSIAISHDGRWLVTGSYDNTAPGATGGLSASANGAIDAQW